MNMSSFRVKKILRIVLFLGVPLAVFFVLAYSEKNAGVYVPSFSTSEDNTRSTQQRSLCHRVPPITTDATVSNRYQSVPIFAKSVLVYDATTRSVLFSKDTETLRPFASLTKILTAATAVSVLGREATVALPESALIEGIPPFETNEEWTVGELASLMLVRSSNDAARAIALGVGRSFHETHLKSTVSDSEATRIFFDAMNEKAKQWNLDSVLTYTIGSVSGLDTEGDRASVAGNTREAAMLMLCAYEEYPDIIGETRHAEVEYRSVSGKPYRINNTNLVVSELPGILASKTGLTQSAGGNLVVLYTSQDGHIIVVAVLGSSKEQRFSDVQALIQETNTILSNLES